MVPTSGKVGGDERQTDFRNLPSTRGRPASIHSCATRAPGSRSELRVDLRRRAVDGRRCGRDLHRAPFPLCRRRRVRVGDGTRGCMVMARLERLAAVETPASTPRHELRVRRHDPVEAEHEVWQMPVSATPHVSTPIRVAGLRGRNLQLMEHRVLRRLARAGLRPGASRGRKTRDCALTKEFALTRGLLFRALAPMHGRDNRRAVADGTAAMSREEAADSLRIAMHRRRPRRVLTALRMLLTEPRPGATEPRS